MNKIDFSAEGMRKAVPSFGDVDVSKAVLPFVETAFETIADLLVEWKEEWTEDIRKRIERLSYIIGCRRAVPHLDLVLTPFGFGIVNNQNHAPASVHRVQALQEELRREESIAYDALLQALLLTPWAMSKAARRIVNSLLWNPTVLRLHGVTYHGEEVYEKEFLALAPLIQSARLQAERIISSELMAALVRRLRFPLETEVDLYEELANNVRHFMATIVMQRQGNAVPLLAEAEQALLHFVKTNKKRLPEYADSATCAAHEMKHYENKKEDGTFFFG